MRGSELDNREKWQRALKDKKHETNGRETRPWCVDKNLQFDFTLARTSLYTPSHFITFRSVLVLS
jgi:hypothetical protein